MGREVSLLQPLRWWNINGIHLCRLAGFLRQFQPFPSLLHDCYWAVTYTWPVVYAQLVRLAFSMFRAASPRLGCMPSYLNVAISWTSSILMCPWLVLIWPVYPLFMHIQQPQRAWFPTPYGQEETGTTTPTYLGPLTLTYISYPVFLPFACRWGAHLGGRIYSSSRVRVELGCIRIGYLFCQWPNTLKQRRLYTQLHIDYSNDNQPLPVNAYIKVSKSTRGVHSTTQILMECLGWEEQESKKNQWYCAQMVSRYAFFWPILVVR